ncbi:MAG: hypothetical protein IPF88_12620 [Candidatus Microthrix sp.]|nr:hypothetical protein [Candidatus Microthrix sp.]MBK6439408.1 hypothetical protein [Candidatus Microthrix sp.]
MKFTTAEIARLLDTGHHGPTCDVERVVLDPDAAGVEDGQLFVASVHPPPLGDTTLVLEDDIANRVPYLTERSWVGGTAVNGPSTETIVRAMAGDPRGRPASIHRVGVLGAVAPWATAALIRAALSDPADHRLPPPGPPELREPPGPERFRLPLALLNHPDDSPLTVVLNRRHRGCTGADAALLAPTTAVITDLGDRHLATLGHAGAVASAKEVLDRLDPDATLVMPEAVADALRAEAGFDATAWPGLSIFDVRTDQHAAAGTVHVVGPWGELAIAVSEDGAALSLPVGAAVAVGVAAGRQPGSGRVERRGRGAQPRRLDGDAAGRGSSGVGPKRRHVVRRRVRSDRCPGRAKRLRALPASRAAGQWADRVRRPPCPTGASGDGGGNRGSLGRRMGHGVLAS